MIGVCVAVDYGTVRHGIAVSDALGITSSPYCAIPAQPEPDAVAAIIDILEAKRAARLIVGLPLNMDGSEGPSVVAARALAAKINAAYPIQTVFVDERLTSVEAESRLLERGLTNKKRKARVDAHAAQIILQDYLASIPSLNQYPTHPE